MPSSDLDTSNGDRPSTLTILGCGALGTAILSGVIKAAPPSPTKLRASINGHTEISFPNRFIACVRRDEAADAIRTKLPQSSLGSPVSVMVRQNLEAAKQSDLVLLACQPHELLPLIDEPGMREALSGKLIISVLAGVTTTQIEKYLQQTQTERTKYFVVKTMPNTACFVRESATVIERPSSSVPQSYIDLTEKIFRCVGKVFYTDGPKMDACTALCGSSPAFFATVVDAIVDGAVALGINRAEAEIMAAQAMRGTADLILSGQQPHNVRNDVASPGGSTMSGLLALEDGRMRATFANAMRASTLGATRLGAHGSAEH